jgi:hypothetical protein
MSDIKQTYKSRAEAFAQFIKSGGYPVAKSQFYDDCSERGIVQVDKTVQLADLIAYVREKFEVDPGSGRSLVDDEYERKMRDLKLRKEIAETESKEKANRKDDDRWMEVVDHQTQMAAFAGLIEDTLKQFTTLRLSTLIYLCGGDIAKAAEFNQGLEELYFNVFTEAVREQTRAIGFEDEDQDAEHGD